MDFDKDTLILLSFAIALVAIVVGTGASVLLARRAAAADKPDPKPWLATALASTVAAWLFGCVLPPSIRNLQELMELAFIASAVGGLLPFAFSFPVVRPALSSTDQAFDAKLRVVFGLVVGGAVGVPVSQYAPIFGGIATMGQPWSPARQSLLGVHVLAFAIIGGGGGYLVTWLKSKQPAVAAPIAAVGPAGDTGARLTELDRLLSQGAITKDEHAAKRAEILKSL
jgi:hypothetical protein